VHAFGLVDAGRDLVVRAHVHLQRVKVRVVDRAQLVLGAGQIAAVHDEVVLEHHLGRRAADPARRPGDQSHFLG